MTEMNIRVETLVKRVTEKSQPVVSKVKRWQVDSRRLASQKSLEALAWVKNAAEQAEKKIHDWEAATPTPEANGTDASGNEKFPGSFAS